jgi:transcriptional regulator with XRE-family HTH domain
MTKRTLGQVLRETRGELGITQRELGRLTGVKASHIAYLENGRRRPSLTLLGRIADVLGLNRRDLLFLSHPEAHYLVSDGAKPARKKLADAWKRFASNRALHRRYKITAAELRVLKQVDLLEHVSSSSHFLFILIAIRQGAVLPD